MCSDNKTGIFEIHIAGPQTDIAIARQVFSDLREVGLTKNKFFLGVYNVPANYGQVACTPPTGHDLENPGWMTTTKTPNFEEAKHYVVAGMGVLARHGIEGNFEVERVISSKDLDYFIEVAHEFPNYQRTPDSPEYENHIIWKDRYANLLSNNDICDVIQTRFGITPHQIVDFSRDPTRESLVSRVATIYQPSRHAALVFGEQLGKDEKLAGHRYMVTEQVCLVGEPKSD